MSPRVLYCAAILLAVGTTLSFAKERTGDDLVEAFRRARQGQPLRVVALGGSITQAGGGWMEDWLQKQFPDSAVTMVNSGMSGTGSSLGIFRVERDVIVHQPDLVAIEFCVNDSGLTDEEAVRYLETLVVRLKKLPHPPAIIFIQAAEKGGVKLERHRRVANHYGLVEVDLQKSSEDFLKSKGQPWETLFSDNVHPNDAGHEFYRKAIAEVLAPYVRQADAATKPVTLPPLPPPLSAAPLLLDATMVALGTAPGWEIKPFIGEWWDRFFHGVIKSEKPGAKLLLPMRGTTFGLYFAMNKKSGSFYATIDGGLPVLISTNHHDGYGYTVFATDLAAREHLISLVLPPESAGGEDFSYSGPVELGYLLVAGQSAATREPSPQGSVTAGLLNAYRFSPIPAAEWSWAGPYRGKEKLDARSLMLKSFPADPQAKGKIEWKSFPAQPELWIDLKKVTGPDLPALVYLRTHIDTSHPEKVLLALSADYFAKVWINAEEVPLAPGVGRSSQAPFFGEANLRAGQNDLLLKVGSGSAGFGFAFSIGRIP